VRFTVQAQPNRTFSGVVSQIRLEPTIVNNVVNYTVVINVANEDGILLPGMTATIDFIVGQAKNVLRVANAALRIKPTEDMLTLLKKEFEARMGAGQGLAPGQGPAGGASPASAGNGASGFSRNGNGSGGRPKDVALIWYLDPSGSLKAARVKTGITDGQQTEIKTDELKEGMEVIKSINLTAEEQAAGGPPRMRIL
jgi:HlyD family secretion protein